MTSAKNGGQGNGGAQLARPKSGMASSAGGRLNKSNPATVAQIRKRKRQMDSKDFKSAYYTNYPDDHITPEKLTEVEDIAELVISTVQKNDCKSKELLLSNVTFSMVFYQELSTQLLHNSRITRLYLDNCSITDNVCQVISYMMKPNTTITLLSLQQNHIRSVGAGHLARFLDYGYGSRSRSKLKHLLLSRNHIGPVGSKMLALSLVHNQFLEILELRENCIDDWGVGWLCFSLKANETLVGLDLQYNPIGVDGYGELQALCRASKNRAIKRSIQIEDFVSSRTTDKKQGSPSQSPKDKRPNSAPLQRKKDDEGGVQLPDSPKAFPIIDDIEGDVRKEFGIPIDDSNGNGNGKRKNTDDWTAGPPLTTSKAMMKLFPEGDKGPPLIGAPSRSDGYVKITNYEFLQERYQKGISETFRPKAQEQKKPKKSNVTKCVEEAAKQAEETQKHEALTVSGIAGLDRNQVIPMTSSGSVNSTDLIENLPGEKKGATTFFTEFLERNPHMRERSPPPGLGHTDEDGNIVPTYDEVLTYGKLMNQRDARENTKLGPVPFMQPASKYACPQRGPSLTPLRDRPTSGKKMTGFGGALGSSIGVPGTASAGMPGTSTGVPASSGALGASFALGINGTAGSGPTGVEEIDAVIAATCAKKGNVSIVDPSDLGYYSPDKDVSKYANVRMFLEGNKKVRDGKKKPKPTEEPPPNVFPSTLVNDMAPVDQCVGRKSKPVEGDPPAKKRFPGGQEMPKTKKPRLTEAQLAFAKEHHACAGRFRLKHRHRYSPETDWLGSGTHHEVFELHKARPIDYFDYASEFVLRDLVEAIREDMVTGGSATTQASLRWNRDKVPGQNMQDSIDKGLLPAEGSPHGGKRFPERFPEYFLSEKTVDPLEHHLKSNVGVLDMMLNLPEVDNLEGVTSVQQMTLSTYISADAKEQHLEHRVRRSVERMATSTATRRSVGAGVGGRMSLALQLAERQKEQQKDERTEVSKIASHGTLSDVDDQLPMGKSVTLSTQNVTALLESVPLEDLEVAIHSKKIREAAMNADLKFSSDGTGDPIRLQNIGDQLEVRRKRSFLTEDEIEEEKRILNFAKRTTLTQGVMRSGVIPHDMDKESSQTSQGESSYKTPRAGLSYKQQVERMRKAGDWYDSLLQQQDGLENIEGKLIQQQAGVAEGVGDGTGAGAGDGLYDGTSDEEMQLDENGYLRSVSNIQASIKLQRIKKGERATPGAAAGSSKSTGLSAFGGDSKETAKKTDSKVEDSTPAKTRISVKQVALRPRLSVKEFEASPRPTLVEAAEQAERERVRKRAERMARGERATSSEESENYDDDFFDDVEEEIFEDVQGVPESKSPVDDGKSAADDGSETGGEKGGKQKNREKKKGELHGLAPLNQKNKPPSSQNKKDDDILTKIRKSQDDFFEGKEISEDEFFDDVDTSKEEPPPRTPPGNSKTPPDSPKLSDAIPLDNNDSLKDLRATPASGAMPISPASGAVDKLPIGDDLSDVSALYLAKDKSEAGKSDVGRSETDAVSRDKSDVLSQHSSEPDIMRKISSSSSNASAKADFVDLHEETTTIIQEQLFKSINKGIKRHCLSQIQEEAALLEGASSESENFEKRASLTMQNDIDDIVGGVADGLDQGFWKNTAKSSSDDASSQKGSSHAGVPTQTIADGTSSPAGDSVFDKGVDSVFEKQSNVSHPVVLPSLPEHDITKLTDKADHQRDAVKKFDETKPIDDGKNSLGTSSQPQTNSSESKQSGQQKLDLIGDPKSESKSERSQQNTSEGFVGNGITPGDDDSIEDLLGKPDTPSDGMNDVSHYVFEAINSPADSRGVDTTARNGSEVHEVLATDNAPNLPVSPTRHGGPGENVSINIVHQMEDSHHEMADTSCSQTVSQQTGGVEEVQLLHDSPSHSVSADSSSTTMDKSCATMDKSEEKKADSTNILKGMSFDIDDTKNNNHVTILGQSGKNTVLGRSGLPPSCQKGESQGVAVCDEDFMKRYQKSDLSRAKSVVMLRQEFDFSAVENLDLRSTVLKNMTQGEFSETLLAPSRVSTMTKEAKGQEIAERERQEISGDTYDIDTNRLKTLDDLPIMNSKQVFPTNHYCHFSEDGRVIGERVEADLAVAHRGRILCEGDSIPRGAKGVRASFSTKEALVNFNTSSTLQIDRETFNRLEDILEEQHRAAMKEHQLKKAETVDESVLDAEHLDFLYDESDPLQSKKSTLGSTEHYRTDHRHEYASHANDQHDGHNDHNEYDGLHRPAAPQPTEKTHEPKHLATSDKANTVEAATHDKLRKLALHISAGQQGLVPQNLLTHVQPGGGTGHMSAKNGDNGYTSPTLLKNVNGLPAEKGSGLKLPNSARTTPRNVDRTIFFIQGNNNKKGVVVNYNLNPRAPEPHPLNTVLNTGERPVHGKRKNPDFSNSKEKIRIPMASAPSSTTRMVA